MLQMHSRHIADYIQENSREPSDLRTVKETEEENIGKEGKLVYSLRDLSRDLKKLSCNSDPFEDDKIGIPKISASRSEMGAEIEEIDSEYEESSEEENKKAPLMQMFLDPTEPLEESAIYARNLKKIKDVPDTIQEEAGDSDFLSDRYESTSLTTRSTQQISEDTRASELCGKASEVC
eukprot:TRINITY_DN4022_c0_g1_i2.p1 TRINITY_DN4022_c0_g1~~TRINITY_DN4022_c0_g1_i2.p1  ORF type:complete len:178 (-),score=33.71 TRINITY_DN4022_c0_g1_i2:233-766(-)